MLSDLSVCSSTTTSEMAARLAVPLLCWIGAMLAHQVAPALIQRDTGTDSILASTGAIITALPHVPYEDALVVQFRYTLPAIIQNVSEIPAEDAAICPLDAAPLCVWEQQLYAATDSLRKAITPATGNVSELQATRQPMLELATYLQTLSTRTSRQKRALWSIIGSAIPLVAEYFPKLISLFKSSPAPHMEQNAILPMEVPLAQSPKGLTGQLLKFKDDFVKFKSMFRQQAATSNNQVDFSAKIAALQLAMNAMFEINTSNLRRSTPSAPSSAQPPQERDHPSQAACPKIWGRASHPGFQLDGLLQSKIGHLHIFRQPLHHHLQTPS